MAECLPDNSYPGRGYPDRFWPVYGTATPPIPPVTNPVIGQRRSSGGGSKTVILIPNNTVNEEELLLMFINML